MVFNNFCHWATNINQMKMPNPNIIFWAPGILFLSVGSHFDVYYFFGHFYVWWNHPTTSLYSLYYISIDRFTFILFIKYLAQTREKTAKSKVWITNKIVKIDILYIFVQHIYFFVQLADGTLWYQGGLNWKYNTNGTIFPQKIVWLWQIELRCT